LHRSFVGESPALRATPLPRDDKGAAGFLPGFLDSEWRSLAENGWPQRLKPGSILAVLCGTAQAVPVPVNTKIEININGEGYGQEGPCQTVGCGVGKTKIPRVARDDMA
jgi:hypothetical protein